MPSIKEQKLRVCVYKCECVYGCLWGQGTLLKRLQPRCSNVNFKWPPWLPLSLLSSQGPRLPLHDIIAEACPSEPPANLPVVTPIETCCSATHTFFSLLLFSSPPSSLSHPPLLWQFPPLFLNQEKALSWARAWSKKRSPPKPLPFCKFNKPTLKICLINGWHLWLEQRRGILLGLGHCWPPN